jgi:hypothetical protein
MRAVSRGYGYVGDATGVTVVESNPPGFTQSSPDTALWGASTTGGAWPHVTMSGPGGTYTLTLETSDQGNPAQATYWKVYSGAYPTSGSPLQQWGVSWQDNNNARPFYPQESLSVLPCAPPGARNDWQ